MKCYLCGSENHFKRDGKVRDDHGINILQCEDCGLVFLDKQNTGDRFYENNSMLSKDFFKLTGRNTEDENLQMQIDVLEKDRMGAIQWRCEFAKPKIIGKDILDFGSGRAEFLILAQPWAKSVAGLEIEAQVKSIYKEHNITLFENIQDITGGGGYDLITAFHVIEHLENPAEILQKLSTILKKNGSMIIEVPNANDALLTIFKNKAYSEFIYTNVHLYCFTPHTLRLLGEKAGLKVEFVKCIQRYPISNHLFWLAHNAPNGQKQWGSFIDNPLLQNAYEQTLASLGATDTLIAQFRKV